MKSWRADIYKTGPPKKRGSVLLHVQRVPICLPFVYWQARMKFDFPLGSVVPSGVKEYVSLPSKGLLPTKGDDS